MWTEAKFYSAFGKLHLLEVIHGETPRELYKARKELTQLNRPERIDNHTGYSVSMLKLSFEACCIHRTLLMSMLGIGVSNKRNFSSCLEGWLFGDENKVS